MITEMIELAVKNIKASIINMFKCLKKMWSWCGIWEILKKPGNSRHEKHNIWNENFTRWEWLHVWHYKKKKKEEDLKTEQHKKP